jgi:hypothetical protein
VRRKATGARASWAMDQESARDAEKWISERLADTVLARLTEPGRSRAYALDPGHEKPTGSCDAADRAQSQPVRRKRR